MSGIDDKPLLMLEQVGGHNLVMASDQALCGI
jgi:hypothetical protein